MIASAGAAAPPIAVVTGLALEARVAAGLGVVTICGSAARIAEQLTDVVARGCRGIVSFGIAGGLVPHVKPGVCVVARSIVTDTERHHAHSEWSQRLLQLIPGAIHADIAHSPVAISTAGHKQDLARTTGAAIVDMESGLAARVAAENKLPFAALRVVADPHDRALPPAAQHSAAARRHAQLGGGDVFRDGAAAPDRLAHSCRSRHRPRPRGVDLQSSVHRHKLRLRCGGVGHLPAKCGNTSNLVLLLTPQLRLLL